MAPYVEDNVPGEIKNKEAPIKEATSKTKYRKIMLMKLTVFHIVTLYTLLFKLHQMMLWTMIYTIFLVFVSSLGITAGAHRLWTHRSYKATWPLKLFLFCCYTLNCQMSVHRWVLTHRQHHKFTDTEADPHNSKRGFFYAHMGWLMVDMTPECRQEEKKIDMSDILSDPFASFHSRYFIYMAYGLILLPAVIPVYIWGEDPFISILTTGILRIAAVFHFSASVNSFTHIYGTKPYDKRIQPTELAAVSFFSLGEGWHNYHHTFPWDYKAAEFGYSLNLTSAFLDFCAKLGLAYDLKSASPQMIAHMKEKYGDGSLAY